METWYVMEDGSVGDPREISADENGVLRHADGRAVAYAPHGPRSRGVDADAERAKAGADAKKAADEAAAKQAAADKAKADAEKAAKSREAKSPEDRELKSKDGETR